MKELKVSDLIDFSEEDYQEAQRVIAEMNSMTKEYVNNLGTENLESLETLKRKFNSMMVYLATFYSKIKCFEESHIMLDGVRKRIKSEAIEHMIANSTDKLSQAAAEKVVYSHPYYVSRVNLLTKLREFFILVDLQYKNYQNVQLSLYQTVSISSKQRQTTIDN